ncbi:hypothetical protein LTR95_015106 [Oleoguttula sp. CCFEE 5521]
MMDTTYPREAYDNSLRCEVAAYCRSADRISRAEVDAEVVKLRSFAIKHGAVDMSEFYTQQEAYRLVSPDVALVPQVYEFFQDDDRGFLIMEFVSDVAEPDPRDMKSITAVAKALTHLHTFTGMDVGPVSGGISRGLLWDHDSPIVHGTIGQLEAYLNHRILNPSRIFDLKDCELSLVHLDAVPRNLRMTRDGRVWLLDWGSAGYYPRWFERCALRLNTGMKGADSEYCRVLEEAILSVSPSSETEQLNISGMLTVVFNNVRYSWGPHVRGHKKRTKLDAKAAMEESVQILDVEKDPSWHLSHEHGV